MAVFWNVAAIFILSPWEPEITPNNKQINESDSCAFSVFYRYAKEIIAESLSKASYWLTI
jgi:hypothetical protein